MKSPGIPQKRDSSGVTSSYPSSVTSEDTLSPGQESPRLFTPTPSEGSVQGDYENLEHASIEDQHAKINAWKQTTQNFPPPEQPSPDTQFHDTPCDLLPEYPATYQLKTDNLPLSILAVRILIHKSLLTPSDIQPLSRTTLYEHQPTDPLTGIASATLETVTNVALGVASIPLSSYHAFKSSPSSDCPLKTRDASKPNPYDKAVLGAAKGVGRVVAAGLKAPMLVTTGVAGGLRNLPGLYGEDVRRVERVEGVVGGVKQAGVGFGTGLYDGLTGIVKKPYDGAKTEGPLGFLKGVGRGIGGVVCKPAAGAVGIAAYPLLGLWREVEKVGKKKDETPGLGREEGDEEEFREEDVRVVVKGWEEFCGKKKI